MLFAVLAVNNGTQPVYMMMKSIDFAVYYNMTIDSIALFFLTKLLLSIHAQLYNCALEKRTNNQYRHIV